MLSPKKIGQVRALRVTGRGSFLHTRSRTYLGRRLSGAMEPAMRRSQGRVVQAGESVGTKARGSHEHL